MKEIWQAAVKECGDKAYQLFCDCYNHYFSCNDEVNRELAGWGDVQLKPLDQLIELDIQRYGKWAFLMYELRTLGNKCRGIDKWEAATYNCGLQLAVNAEVRRKLYANAPFNIEWAKAGVAVEVQIIHSKEWVIKTKGLSGYYIDSFRHPFPPLKELGL